MINTLKPESEVLSRIAKGFQTMLRARTLRGEREIKITCFYEELGIRAIGPVRITEIPVVDCVAI